MVQLKYSSTLLNNITLQIPEINKITQVNKSLGHEFATSQWFAAIGLAHHHFQSVQKSERTSTVALKAWD